MISKQMESCASSFITLAFKTRDFQEKKQIKFKQIAHETSLHFKQVFFFLFWWCYSRRRKKSIYDSK